MLLAVAMVALSAHVRAGDALFGDPVIVKAKTFQIKESDLEDAYTGYKAAAAAMGRPAPAAMEDQLKKQILDKLIATRLLIGRATPQDQDEGKKLGEKLIQQTRTNAGNEAAYRRRLLAVGSTPEKYEKEIQEQALVQVVIDRELKNKELITDTDIRKFYDEHPEMFTEPEKAKVAHILFALRKIPTGEPLSPDERAAKKKTAEAALARAKSGEDFAKLVKEFSDDTESKDRGGELTFARGSQVVPAPFEAAAFSLQPGQISDLVLTVFGYDIIKLLEKTPAGRIPLDKLHDTIGERLQRQGVQAKLPDFVQKLKKDADVQVLQIP